MAASRPLPAGSRALLAGLRYNYSMKRQQLATYTSFWADPVVKYSFVTAIGLWLTSTASMAWYYSQLTPIIPLFYSLSRGPLQLAYKPFFWILPIMSLVFWVTHLIFSWINYDQDMVFGRIMSVSAVVGVFIFSVAIWHIIWIVV